MFKSRRKKSEEEARLDPEYRPTNELHAEGEEEVNRKTNLPLGFVITISVLIILIIACIIIIYVSGGPLAWDGSSSIN